MGMTPEYWAANRERILAQRKQKYRADAEYRRKALERARKRRAKLRKDRAKKENFVFLKKKRVRVYPAGEVAERLGISINVISDFRRRGLIPEAIKTSPRRKYTDAQIAWIGKLVALRKDYSDCLRGRSNRDRCKEYRAKLLDLVSSIYDHWHDPNPPK